MPANIHGDDYWKVGLATAVPGAAFAAAYAAFVDKSTLDWWQQLKKPSWAPKDLKVYTVGDVLTTLPLGCASYLVYKHGGGFDNKETALALAAYGANLGLALLSIPAMSKTRNHKCLLGNTLGLGLTAGAMAVLFHRVHKTAGWMVTPYALWTGFYVLLMSCICKEEEDAKKKAGGK